MENQLCVILSQNNYNYKKKINNIQNRFYCVCASRWFIDWFWFWKCRSDYFPLNGKIRKFISFVWIFGVTEFVIAFCCSRLLTKTIKERETDITNVAKCERSAANRRICLLDHWGLFTSIYSYIGIEFEATKNLLCSYAPSFSTLIIWNEYNLEEIRAKYIRDTWFLLWKRTFAGGYEKTEHYGIDAQSKTANRIKSSENKQ